MLNALQLLLDLGRTLNAIVDLGQVGTDIQLGLYRLLLGSLVR